MLVSMNDEGVILLISTTGKVKNFFSLPELNEKDYIFCSSPSSSYFIVAPINISNINDFKNTNTMKLPWLVNHHTDVYSLQSFTSECSKK